ncbi:hypothetical protein BC829DRAFT_389028, partial [Chytridium lagenaria]
MAAFEKYGAVKDVYVPKDYYTNRIRGFAYVQFAEQDEADRAFRRIEYLTINGKRLTVEWAAGARKTPDQMRGRGDGDRGSGGRGSAVAVWPWFIKVTGPLLSPRGKSDSRSRSRSRRGSDRRSRSRSRSRRTEGGDLLLDLRAVEGTAAG